MSKNGIYLSGWEYNRVLKKNPLSSQQSALPAEALWNGGAQFWLFEHVYCTKEALDGEIAAAETLGWATGKIFQDLQRRGFLEAFDWKDIKRDSPLKYNCLVENHKWLSSQYDEKSILYLLSAGNDVTLEAVKLDLLKPILEHLNCIHNVSPNSINKWMASYQSNELALSRQTKAIQRLAEPFAKRNPIKAGMRLCNPPGTGVSDSARQAQKEVEENIQKPMIPDLLAGKLSQKDYMDALLPTAKVYKPIDTQLLNDYQVNIEKLERLRDVAKSYLWKNLHDEWIPELEQNPKSLAKFERRLRDALARSCFDPFLDYLTVVAIAIISTAVGGISLSLAPLAGLPPEATAAIAGTTTREILSSRYKELRKESEDLTLFFQKAKRVVNARK